MMKLQQIFKTNTVIAFDEIANDSELSKQVQIRLIALKLLAPPADGVFGEASLSALKQFQSDTNCNEDGIGTRTAEKLIETKEVETTVDTNETDNVPEAAIILIKEFEGLFLKAYVDPLSGGKPITIGYGCTRKLDGSEWELGESITEDEANQLLAHQLQHSYIPSLSKIPCWEKLTDNQKSALISFGYNLGADFFGNPNFSTMTRVLREELWNEIEHAFLLYCNPGTSVHEGLLRRRKREAQLFLSDVK